MHPLPSDEGSQIQPAGHIDNRDLTLYVFDRLDSERSLGLQAHVRVCAACKDKLVVGFLARLDAGHKGDERRAEGRLQSCEEGYVQMLFPLSFERSPVQIIDMSQRGFGLRMNSSLATGIIVQVCMGTTTALGEVRSCQSTDENRFRVGIRVQNADELKRK